MLPVNISLPFKHLLLLSLVLGLWGCQALEVALAPDPEASKLGQQSPTVSPSPTTQQPDASPSPDQDELVLDPVQSFADLDEAPDNLVGYIQDLAQLEVLNPASETAENEPLFQPNQVITRATFARWLLEANNRLNRDRPIQQIRLATRESSTPAFTDVPTTHPDFAVIQGLAESGYIPSALSGDTTEKTFRPEAPLTRETLVQWKVPLDQQKILPTVTATKVKEVWGFKDSDKVNAQTASAIVADHANGDLSNIRRFAGSTLLFQPQKKVSRAEAAAALWYIGVEGQGYSAKDVYKADVQTTAPKVSPNPNGSFSPSPNPTQTP